MKALVRILGFVALVLACLGFLSSAIAQEQARDIASAFRSSKANSFGIPRACPQAGGTVFRAIRECGL